MNIHDEVYISIGGQCTGIGKSNYYNCWEVSSVIPAHGSDYHYYWWMNQHFSVCHWSDYPPIRALWSYNSTVDTCWNNSINIVGHCLIQWVNSSTLCTTDSSKVRLHCPLPWILGTVRRQCFQFHPRFLSTTRAAASHCSFSLGFGFTLFQLQLPLSSCWATTWQGALRGDKSYTCCHEVLMSTWSLVSFFPFVSCTTAAACLARHCLWWLRLSSACVCVKLVCRGWRKLV